VQLVLLVEDELIGRALRQRPKGESVLGLVGQGVCVQQLQNVVREVGVELFPSKKQAVCERFGPLLEHGNRGL